MKGLWKCSVCGYVHEGEEAPVNCPKCGAPQEKFEALSEDAANLIRRSDFSNDLHMELVKLAMKMDEICKAGIEDALDPTCVIVFNKTKDRAWEIKQMCKAELVAHVGKGKF